MAEANRSAFRAALTRRKTGTWRASQASTRCRNFVRISTPTASTARISTPTSTMATTPMIMPTWVTPSAVAYNPEPRLRSTWENTGMTQNTTTAMIAPIKSVSTAG